MIFPDWSKKIMIGAELAALAVLLITARYGPGGTRGGAEPGADAVAGAGTGAVAGTGAIADAAADAAENGYIKWVDFTVPASVLTAAYRQDVDTYMAEHGGQENDKASVHLNWIELLAYLAARYGGDFGRYREKDLTALCERLKNGESMEELTQGMKYYPYYLEAYTAVLGGMVGEYEIQVDADEAAAFVPVDAVVSERTPQADSAVSDGPEPPAQTAGATAASTTSPDSPKTWVTKYGLKAFLPIARYFPYEEYDDFGVSRSYGYKRQHLGHDMMGQVGTPIIAVESGRVEAMGWNQYGGWRLGIRSFDGKRYYYYAHLRQNYPYHKSLSEGSVVQAGDVIGYLGMTGYSTTEDTNGMKKPHLHFGMQLVFDESQKESDQEIWIDVYEIVKFLSKHRSYAQKDEKTGDYKRSAAFFDLSVESGAEIWYTNHNKKIPSE